MSVRKAGKVLLYSLAGVLGLILLLMLAIKLALDRAPAYQAEIKEWVQAQIGYHVAFARVSPSFRWYGPELHFDALELRSKDDRRVLVRAGGGRVAADIWQLLSSGKLLAGRVEIDSPDIVIARLGPSSFALASEIKLGGDDASVAKLELNDLPAGKLTIRHAAVTLQNWNESLPQLALQDVNLDLRRNDEGLTIVLAARLPPSLGGILTASGNIRGAGDLRTLNWNATVRARDIFFPGWRMLLPEYLSRLDAGSGAFKLTARGQGLDLTRADLNFGALGVATQLADGPLVKFEQIGGELTMIHAADRWTLAGKKVRAQRAGHRDPDSEFAVSWRGGDAGLLDLQARASYLRADTLLPLTGLLPQKKIRDRLHDFAPTGEWMDAAVAMQRNTPGAPWRLQVQAKFRDVGFAPMGRAPGLRGLTGVVAGNERGGRIDMDTRTAVFTWPAQLPQPVQLDLLKATLYWKRTAAELLVASSNWEMRNRDAGVRAIAAWQQPSDGGSPVLTLASVVEHGNAANVRNYLPRERISPPALAWLNRAFVAGRMPRADIVIRGPMRHFPFRDGTGLFLARCTLEGVTLDYSDGWPRVDNLSARAEFRNEGLNAHFLAGRIGDISVRAADARFADFKTGELEIHLTAGGDARDALAFLRATPLEASTDHAFSGVEAQGSLQSRVDLFLPFKDFVHRRVLVHGVLQGVTVNRPGSNVLATEVSGDFDMDGGQVARADVHGRLLGGAFQMQARAPRNRAVTRTQLDFRGYLTGEALRAALALPPSLSIGGQTDWRAVLKMAPEPNRERSLRVMSNLMGLEMRLPAPLAKAANTQLQAWFEIQWPAGGAPQGQLALGSVVRGSYALKSDANGLSIAHATLNFGDDEARSGGSQMFNLGGSVSRLDLAGWLKLKTPDRNAKPLADYLTAAQLNVAELDYLGLAFRELSLNLAVSGSGLRINVSGPNVAGTITLPSGGDSAEPWNLQFDRLHFDVVHETEKADSDGGNQAAGDSNSLVNPRGIPSLNFHAADLNWGGRAFGDVRATLTKLDDGVSLTQLVTSSASFNVSAKGEWRGRDAGLARIEGDLDSSDVQATLKQLGYADVLDAKAGRLDFDLSWVGAPTGAALAEATGRIQLSLDKGQVVGLKPGAGRVLGIASLAALPRRLALDFSDLTDKGLAFDTVRGDFDLRGGSLYTDNVLLKGPAAEIGLIGRVGLKNKDYDQTAVVTGNLGDSPLPLAGFVGGPVVGAAVLLFTQVFKQPLKGLARGYYRITGGWDNPTVERITSAGAAAATAEVPR